MDGDLLDDGYSKERARKSSRFISLISLLEVFKFLYFCGWNRCQICKFRQIVVIGLT